VRVHSSVKWTQKAKYRFDGDGDATGLLQAANLQTQAQHE
jgi:hypothetical protein